jgi:hypothetical protein
VTLPIPATTVATASRTAIIPTGVIFADKSSVGDATFIASVFHSRAAQRTAWRQVVRALEKAKAERGPFIAALERAITEIDSKPHDDVGDQVRASAHANLQEVVTAARSQDPQALSLFDFLLLRARQSVAAADAHAR